MELSDFLVVSIAACKLESLTPHLDSRLAHIAPISPERLFRFSVSLILLPFLSHFSSPS